MLKAIKKYENHSADSWQHASVHLRVKNSQEAAGKSLGASSSLVVRAEILEEVELNEPSNRSPFPYRSRTKTEQKAQA